MGYHLILGPSFLKSLGSFILHSIESPKHVRQIILLTYMFKGLGLHPMGTFPLVYFYALIQPKIEKSNLPGNNRPSQVGSWKATHHHHKSEIFQGRCFGHTCHNKNQSCVYKLTCKCTGITTFAHITHTHSPFPHPTI